MERLQEVREIAMQDPLSFVTALQNGDNLNLPSHQDIAQVRDGLIIIVVVMVLAPR